MDYAINAYYNLAHQYIAAELNFLAGADNSAVTDVFDLATTYLLSYSPADIKGLKGNNATRKAFIYLGGVLEDANLPANTTVSSPVEALNLS